MRKFIVLPVIAALLAISVIFTVSHLVDNQKDFLKIKETVLYGNRSAAEGLSVELDAADSDYEQDNVWKLTYTLQPGGKLKNRSVFQKQSSDKLFSGQSSPEKSDTLAVNLEIYNCEDSFFTLAEAQKAYPHLAAVLSETAEQTKAGETRSQFIPLAETQEYLPLQFTKDYSRSRLEIDRDRHGKPLDFSYFEIPTPNQYTTNIEVQKNSSGAMTNVKITSSQSYFLDSHGLELEDGCYLAVTRLKRNWNGKEVTVSEYPENRRGIHFIPYYENTEEEQPLSKYLDMRKAELVFPLEENVEVVALLKSPGGDDLLLFTKEHEKVMAVVIDRKTMKAKYRQQVLAEYPADPASLTFENYENCTLICDGEGRYRLLYEENGLFGVIPFNLSDMKALKKHYGKSLRRLAPCAASVKHGKGAIVFIDEIEADTPINHCLLVADKDKMLYAGSYEYSLTAGTSQSIRAAVKLNYGSSRPAVITMEE